MPDDLTLANRLGLPPAVPDEQRDAARRAVLLRVNLPAGDARRLAPGEALTVLRMIGLVDDPTGPVRRQAGQ